MVDVEVMDGKSRLGKIFLFYNSIEVLRKRHGQKVWVRNLSSIITRIITVAGRNCENLTCKIQEQRVDRIFGDII